MPDPGRKYRRSFSELLALLPDLAVVIDSFEQKVQRPQGTDPTNRKSRQEADKWYSGKKKTHTIKSQVGVDLHTGLICEVSESVRGPTADITLLKDSGLLDRLPPGVGGEGDLAYIGIDKEHPQGAQYAHTPLPCQAEARAEAYRSPTTARTARSPKRARRRTRPRA